MHQVRDSKTVARAKDPRRTMTPPERAMWSILRAHRLQNWKFTRQVPVGPFVVDFAARRERLAIELDGDSHASQADYDARRTKFLANEGWKVIRFANTEIVRNPEGVAVAILEFLASNAPSPRPSPQRGEGESR